MMRKFVASAFFLLSAFLTALAVWGSPIANIAPFPTKSDGQTVFAADWNTITNITTWINSTLLNSTTGLNSLNTMGDMYVYNGTNLQRFPAGVAGQMLQATNSSPGLVWAAVANLSTLTTNGDMVYYNSGANQRLPIGTANQVLTVSGGLPTWQSPASIPVGGILAWSPAAAGTTTIPSGYALCDGLVHSGITTPNLIGRFILGCQPAGGGATPSAGGYGSKASDTTGGVTSYVQSLSISSPGTNAYGSGTNAAVFPGNVSGTASISINPAYYTLVYICRIQ